MLQVRRSALLGPTKVLALTTRNERPVPTTLTSAIHEVGADSVMELLARRAMHEVKESSGAGSLTAYYLSLDLMHIIEKTKSAGADFITTEHALTAFQKELVEHLVHSKQDVNLTTLSQVLTTAHPCSPDAAGLAKQLLRVGPYGLVTTIRGKSTARLTEKFLHGYTLPCTLSYWLVNKYSADFEFEEPLILLADRVLSVMEIIPVLTYANEQGRALVILSSTLSKDVVTLLTKNVELGALDCAFVTIPFAGDERTEFITDIQTITGACCFDISKGNVSVKGLGTCKTAEFTPTTLCLRFKSKVASTLTPLLAKLEQQYAKSKDEYERSKLRGRIAKLSLTSLELTVGGISESEIERNYLELLDLVYVGRTAQKGGVVPGGLLPFVDYIDTKPNALFTPALRETCSRLYGADLLSITKDTAFDVLSRCCVKRSQFTKWDSFTVIKNVVEKSVSAALTFNKI